MYLTYLLIYKYLPTYKLKCLNLIYSTIFTYIPYILKHKLICTYINIYLPSLNTYTDTVRTYSITCNVKYLLYVSNVLAYLPTDLVIYLYRTIHPLRLFALSSSPSPDPSPSFQKQIQAVF